MSSRGRVLPLRLNPNNLDNPNNPNHPNHCYPGESTPGINMNELRRSLSAQLRNRSPPPQLQITNSPKKPFKKISPRVTPAQPNPNSSPSLSNPQREQPGSPGQVAASPRVKNQFSPLFVNVEEESEGAEDSSVDNVITGAVRLPNHHNQHNNNNNRPVSPLSLEAAEDPPGKQLKASPKTRPQRSASISGRKKKMKRHSVRLPLSLSTHL